MLRRALVMAALAAAAVVILAPPVRGWWSQRQDIDVARADLAELRADNERIESRLESVADPAEVERIARDQLGLVREGEESYLILPPSTAGLVLPNAWPFNRVAAAMQEAGR